MLLRYAQLVVLCSGLLASTQVIAQQAETTQSPRGQDSIAPPRLIKIAGVIKDEIGRPAYGPISVTFSVYKDDQSGTPLWVETQTVAVDSNGHYIAFLGATTKEGIPTNLFNSSDTRWLGVKANNVEQERIMFGAPYTLKGADLKGASERSVATDASSAAIVDAGEPLESRSLLYELDTLLPPSTQIIKDVRGPGCSGNTCTSTATWPGGGFVDTNYTVACSPDRGTSQPMTGELITLTKTKTSITVQLLGVCAEGCDSPSMTAFECIAVHD